MVFSQGDVVLELHPDLSYAVEDLARKIFILVPFFFVVTFTVIPSYSSTKYGEYDPNVVLIPAHNHPYWNSRAAVASLQLGYFFYNSLLLYEVHQPESLGTDIALYGDIVVTGSLAIYFMIKSMILSSLFAISFKN